MKFVRRFQERAIYQTYKWRFRNLKDLVHCRKVWLQIHSGSEREGPEIDCVESVESYLRRKYAPASHHRYL